MRMAQLRMNTCMPMYVKYIYTIWKKLRTNKMYMYVYVYIKIKIFQIITLLKNALHFYAFRNNIEKSTFCRMLFEMNMWYK